MDLALKQRLVGASVLIALAVIFLPLLFDDTNADSNQSISIEIPNEPIELRHKVLSIDSTNQNSEQRQEIKEVSAEQPTIKKQETVVEIVDNSKSMPESSTSKPVILKPKKEVVTTTKAKKPKEKPPSKVITKAPVVSAMDEDTKYRIKLGVFAEAKNAQKIKAQLIHNGIEALVERDAATGMYKVYSKQNANLSQIKKLNAQIQKLDLNIGKTSIETLDKSASDDAQMLLDTGWIVQIGIFSSQVNSLKLRDKIRKKGFICFVDSISNSSNKKMYRVRVGPYATRDEAIVELNKIKKSMNLKGLVKPHEKQKVVS